MDAEDLTFETHSPQETERLGRALAALIPLGAVAALRGDLASGKTCLVRGMASRFAVGEPVSSPTFTLVNQYGDSPRLYHVDLYRLTHVEELADIGYEEIFDPDGVCVVEWAERAEPLLPARRLDICLQHVDETTRRITLANSGVLPPGWRGLLSSRLAAIDE
jgi:tRNA threonylcarbamoyladenosine biosynthesis protein TsaE